MKKSLIIIIACVSILIIVSLIIFFSNRYSMQKLPDSSNSQFEVILTNNIMKIFDKNTKRGGTCEIDTDKYGYLINGSNKVTYVNINKNERAVYVAENNSLSKNLKPVEIYSIFESFLYLKNIKLPYNIVAISCDYISGGLDNHLEMVTAIRLSEFQELYSNTDLKGLNSSDAAKKLADKWIKQTGYVKK